MTHYYYLVFAFFVSILYLIYQLFLKKWKDIFIYTAIMSLSLGAGILYFPASITHIFSSYRGEEAVSNLFNPNMFEKLKGSLEIVNRQLFAIHGKTLLILTIFFILISIFLRISIRLKDKIPTLEITWFESRAIQLPITKDLIFTLSVIFVCMTYIGIISKIAPYITDRYIFNTFPLIIMSLIIIAHYLFERFYKSMKIFFCFVLCIFILISMNSYRNGYVNYLFLGQNDRKEAIEGSGVSYAIYRR